MCGHKSWPRGSAGVAALAFLVLVTRPVLSQSRPGEIKHQIKKLKELFPAFENRKNAMGPLALVGDFVVVEDVPGEIDKVYREDSKVLGRSLLDTLALALGNKGYSFSSRTLVSVGDVVNDKKQCRVLEHWEQREEDTPQFPLQSSPFYRDSVLCTSDSTRAAWHGLLSDVWSFRKTKKEPGHSLESAPSLRTAIGTDYALVVVVVATKATLGKALAGDALSGLPLGKTLFGKKSAMKLSFDSWEKVRFPPSVDFDAYSGLGMKLAVIDFRNGEVLWSDGDHNRWGLLGVEALHTLTRDIIKRMI